MANPPWVSLSGRQAPTDPRVGAHVSAWTRTGWPSLHGAFLVRIARHVAEHGSRAEVLLPASLCEQELYADLRPDQLPRAFTLADPLQRLLLEDETPQDGGA